MARTPRAARTLIRQLNERAGRKPDSTTGAEPFGEVDGFGVHRRFKFDKGLSKGLVDLLAAANDPRVTDVSEREGRVIVTFSPRTIADDKADFDFSAEETETPE